MLDQHSSEIGPDLRFVSKHTKKPRTKFEIFFDHPTCEISQVCDALKRPPKLLYVHSPQLSTFDSVNLDPLQSFSFSLYMEKMICSSLSME